MLLSLLETHEHFFEFNFQILTFVSIAISKIYVH